MPLLDGKSDLLDGGAGGRCGRGRGAAGGARSVVPVKTAVHGRSRTGADRGGSRSPCVFLIPCVRPWIGPHQLMSAGQPDLDRTASAVLRQEHADSPLIGARFRLWSVWL